MDCGADLTAGRYDTFVVRLRRDGGHVRYVAVTHVGTGRVRRFRDPQHALAFMLARGASSGAVPNEPDAE